MTPQEFRSQLREFGKTIGSHVWISAGVTAFHYGSEKPPLDCSVYPNGLSNDRTSFTVYAEDWAGLMSAVKAKWADYQSEYARQTARKLALAIIRITADTGQCTDAALRIEFSDTLVDQFADAAVADANKIAANGPFEVIKKLGNGAPADAVERNPARTH